MEPELVNMIPIAYTRFFLLTLPLLLLQGAGACAQGVVFTANASAYKVGLQDQFQVTFVIQNAGNLKGLNCGAFKDFRVLGGPFQSQNTSFVQVGNQMSQSISLSSTYVLQPKHTGTIVIPPGMAVDMAGHSYKSNALKIQVVQGSVANQQQRQRAPGNGWEDDDPFEAADRQRAAMIQQLLGQTRTQGTQQSRPQAAGTSKADLGRDIFIKVDVDKKQVSLGEQVTAVYKLYARVPMQVGISKLPSLNGFYTQDFDIPKKPKPFEEIVNGKKYQVFILKKSALFPQQKGNLILDAAEAEGTARVMAGRRSQSTDPFGNLMMDDPFFSDPFGGNGYEDVPVHLKSAPVSINVTDVPDGGKPANYTGAVGNFALHSKMDKTTLTTDDVATLTLNISGSGNLKLFDAPKLTVPEGIDSYEPHILDTITGRTTTISGEKEVSYTIAPHRTGDFEIPAMSLSWYDPATRSYKSASTPAYKIHVKQGKAATYASKAGGSQDIKDNIVSPSAKPLILSPLYWSMYALPLLALLGVTVYRKKEDELEADSAQLRNRRANKIAQKRLAAAGLMLQKGHQKGFYDEVSKAIWLYLSDKLGIPISSLGKAAAAAAMTDRGVPTTIQQQIDSVLSECELALYAPTAGAQQMQQTFSEAACIITGLERTLRT